MRAALTIFGLLLSVLVAGCMSVQLQPLQPERMAQRFEARSLLDESLHRCLAAQLGDTLQWPPAKWDVRLLSLAAVCDNPSLAVAKAQADSAAAAAIEAGARLNPSLQFPFEYNTDHEGAGKPFTTGPQLEIPIETAGKRDDRMRIARHKAQAARLQVANKAWQLRSEVRAAMLAMYGDARRTDLLEKQTQFLKQVLAMQQARVRVGASAEPETSSATWRWTQSQAELAASRQALLDDHARLAKAIGIPLPALDRADIDWSEFERLEVVLPADREQRTALLHRADLQASLSEYEAAQAALELEVARQYPDIHLGLGYTYDEGANKISFGLASITLPIFNHNRGAITHAVALRAEAAARTEALQDGLIQNLQQAQARYRSNLQAWKIARANLQAAKRQLDNQSLQFSSGNIGHLEWAQAEADYQASAVNALHARVSVQDAIGQLEDTIQQSLAAADTPDTISQESSR